LTSKWLTFQQPRLLNLKLLLNKLSTLKTKRISSLRSSKNLKHRSTKST
jgi:hypothetical protein